MNGLNGLFCNAKNCEFYRLGGYCGKLGDCVATAVRNLVHELNDLRELSVELKMKNIRLYNKNVALEVENLKLKLQKSIKE